MGKKRVIIDTNIFISAFGWEGKSRKLLERVIEHEIIVVMSLRQYEEIKRVLDYPKFGFTAEQKAKFLDILDKIALLVDSEPVDVISADPSDNVIVEAADKADFIVSGDEHVLSVGRSKGARIMTVGDFFRFI